MRAALRSSLLALLLVACPSNHDAVEEVVLDVGPNLDVYVGETVRFDGRGTTGAARFRWVFGDGGQTDFQDQGLAEHVYTEPGYYAAGLTVTDAEGRLHTETVSVRVTFEPRGAPGRMATTIGATNDTLRLFVPLPDFDVIAVVDRRENTVTGHLPTCEQPRSVSVSATDVLVTACRGDDRVEVFDAAAESLGEASRGTVDLPYGSAPWSVAIEPGGGSAYVALPATAQLGRITLDPPGVERLGDASKDTRGLAVDDDRRFTTRFRSPWDAGEWFVWEDQSPSYHRLDYDLGPDSDTTNRGVPNYLTTFALSPDGRRAAIPGLIANTARGIDRDGKPLTHENTVRAFVELVDVDPDSGTYGDSLNRLAFDDRGFASTAAFSPRGDLLFVAMLGMESVEVLDAYTLQRVSAFSNVCGGPDGLWVTPDEAVLWVSCGLSRELVGMSLGDLSAPPVEIARIDLRPAGTEVLDPAVLRGKRLFTRSADLRMTRSGYMSCAVCHLDGEDDGRTWDFTDRGEGLRNTISLVGRAGEEHGPLHWSASFDEVHDFENDIREAFLGQGFLSEADWAETEDTLGRSKEGRSAALDDLADYMRSLDAFPRSPYRGPGGEPSEEGRAGAVVFASAEAGCVQCHPAPDFTDSRFLASGEPLLHDVGTLRGSSGGRLGGALTGIDTPTLRGVWATAPYLHDGSADTLREVLVDRNSEGLHGGAANLSEEELDQLIRFLLELE